MDSVIITMAIDAYEGKGIAKMDIPFIFQNTENNEFVLKLLQGKPAEVIVQLYPKLYRKLCDQWLKRIADAICESE